MNSLRIVFVDYTLEPDKPGRSGLSDIVWDMATALIDLGHEAHIVACYHTQTYPDTRVQVHNFAEPPIGYRNLIGQLWILKRAARIVASLSADIVHAPEYVSTAVLQSLGLTAPLVLTVPGNIYQRIEQGHDYEWFYVHFLKWAATRSAASCDKVIATSQEMKTWWERTGSLPHNTPCIPIGIDPSRFYPVPDAKTRLGISAETSTLLYAGRFAREKGLSDLIEAFQHLRPALTQQHVKLYLIGKGKREADLRQQIAASKLDQWIEVCGWVAQEELNIWFSAADAFLLPSWDEPFGRVMLEAMACGTPVIASATAGPLDHIEHAYNGFLFEPHDVSQLTQILQQVLAQPQELAIMGQHSLNYVSTRFTWAAIMRQLVEQIYYPLIAHKQVATVNAASGQLARGFHARTPAA